MTLLLLLEVGPPPPPPLYVPTYNETTLTPGYRLSYTDPAGFEYWLTDGVVTTLAPGGMRGFGVAAATASGAQVPYRDGIEHQGGLYTPAREMEIALQIICATPPAWLAYQRAMISNIGAYKDLSALGTLAVYTPDGLKRSIDCWMVEWPDPVMSGQIFGVVTPKFWAEYPFFYNPTAKVETLGLAGNGGITFPITFPITFVSTTIDSRIYPHNGGNVEAWPVVCVNGPGQNLTLENETTAKTMAITQTMDAGDHIDIDMVAATVYFYDATTGLHTSIIELISDASEFWPLVVGDNTIHVLMTATVSGSVVFTYNEYFLHGL